jgi:uncharacterized protein (DUF58 family)
MLEARAFEPGFLRRLDGLVLGIKRARTVRAGRRTLGRIQGAGIEPENFREYTEGDDLRFLDWNALARLDDLLIRTYRAERQVEINILVDASASMSLPEQDDKLGLALGLGAALAYVGLSDNDPARMVAFSARRGAARIESSGFQHRRETYPGFRPFVTAVKCGGETRLSAAIGQFLHERRPAGVVVVLSDFLVSPLDYQDALGQLLAARHEVKVIHVMGEQETAGSYPHGLYRVRDCETGEMRDVEFGAKTAAACRLRVAEHGEALRAFCASCAIAYAQAFGAGNFDQVVTREFPRLGIIR